MGQRIGDLRDAFGSRVPVLIVLRGVQLGRRYLLNEDALVLGRKVGRADIVIEGDPQISGAHARIYKDSSGENRFIRDLDSLNGTLVNGNAVQETVLKEGDKIVIGQTILKFTYQDAIEESFHGRLDQLMNVDDLTGLAVMRVFSSHIHEKLSRMQAAGQPLGVLMMDMDGLKKINDTHGHEFGAYTISEVGKLIGRCVQNDGEAARFGGDEFVAYLEGFDKQRSVDRAEQIRTEVAAFPFCLHEIKLAPTMSIGVAAFPEDGSTIEVLMRKADEALYRAKRGGRNRVCV